MKLHPARCDLGQRLDLWLASHIPHLSRSRIQALIRSGHITVGPTRVSPHTRLTAGMEILVHVPPAQTTEILPENIPLNILHEDADLIVLNKPPGLVVHTAPGHPSGTLVNALLHHCRDLAGIGGEKRPGIVHRLDKDTSGVMVVAKNQKTMDALARQFKNGRVHKEYGAVIHGVPTPASGTIQTLIARHPRDRKKMCAQPLPPPDASVVSHSRGRHAITHYEVVRVLGDFAWIRLQIETGRTHQIRVHMAHIGHPVVGDAQYGKKRAAGLPFPAARHLLHARSLSFQHPSTRQRRSFIAPWPDDMAAWLA